MADPLTLTPVAGDPFAEPLTIHAANWQPSNDGPVDSGLTLTPVSMPGEGSPAGPLPQMYPPSVDRGYVTPVDVAPNRLPARSIDVGDGLPALDLPAETGAPSDAQAAPVSPFTLTPVHGNPFAQ